jgi:MoxR-like ATPase
MRLHDPTLPTINPRLLLDEEGDIALADLLRGTGYVIQQPMLRDMAHVLKSCLPWLIEGPRGGGKTALAEALADACNLPIYYLQGMEGLNLADVLYDWDREGQTQWVRQAIETKRKHTRLAHSGSYA